ncbi:MAG: S9 family peptidase, partial [Gammaproteobacteria bacterium]|nr:S9 family peptidase [Gammaproteobacteria bacterium]
MKSPRNDSSMLHPSAEVLPYGFWPSTWSAEAAAAASQDYAELRTGHGGLFWVEYDPVQGRCTLWFWQAGSARCLTPDGFSVRSRVYEYGG